jgi:hypothetical protein
MVDSNHCSQCNALLIEIDFYGERLVGCIECNRWTRDGWLFMHLLEENLEALRGRLNESPQTPQSVGLVSIGCLAQGSSRDQGLGALEDGDSG